MADTEIARYLVANRMASQLALLLLLLLVSTVADMYMPEGWTAHVDKQSGKPYYFHEASKTSQWEHPGAAAVLAKTQGTKTLHGVRSQFATCSMLDEASLFVTGGVGDKETTVRAGGDSHDVLSSVVMYNRTIDSWVAFPSMIDPRCNSGCGVIAWEGDDGRKLKGPGRLFAIGGQNPVSYDVAQQLQPALASVEVFDPTRVAVGWQRAAPLGVPRAGHGVAVLEGVMYVAGGYRLSSVEKYDTRLDRWQAAGSMVRQRANFAMGCLGEYMYAFAGWTAELGNMEEDQDYPGAFRNDGEVFSELVGRWRMLATNFPDFHPARQWFGGVAVVAHQLFVVGGFTGNVENRGYTGVGAIARFTATPNANGEGEWHQGQNLPASIDALQSCMFGVGAIGETLLVVGGKATADAVGCESISCAGETCCPGCPPVELEKMPEGGRLKDLGAHCFGRDHQLWCRMKQTFQI